MRKLTAVLSALSMFAVLAVAAPAVQSASRTVSVRDNYFSPKSKTVSRNTTMVWRFSGKAAHNVVVNSGPVKFRSSLRRGGTYRHKMTRKGTYRIVCTIHSGMSMKLTVR